MKILLGYLIIGVVYSNFTLLRNMINNGTFRGDPNGDHYNEESLQFKVASYLMDFIIWPFGIYCDFKYR